MEVLQEAKEMLTKDPNAFSYLGGGRLKKGKMKRLYDEPALPPSAYMIFSKEKGAKLREKNPGHDLQFYGRTLGEMWRSLDSTKKIKYLKLAEEARQQYDKDYSAFVARHPELDRKKISRAPTRPHDAPVKARSAFYFFCDEYRSQLTEGTRREKQKQLMEMFKSAGPKEQTLFHQKAADDKLRYNQELTEYVQQHPDQAQLLSEKTGKSGKHAPDLPFAAPAKNLYMYFCQRQRKKLLSELPPHEKADFSTMSKQLAVEWKSVDQATKDKLTIKYQKAQKKFEKKLNEYVEDLSEEDRTTILKKYRPADKTHVQGHPDIPLYGFKAYSQSKRIEVKGLNPSAKPTQINKDLMDMWVALTYSERLKWKGIEEAMKSKSPKAPDTKDLTKKGKKGASTQKEVKQTGGSQLKEESDSSESDDSKESKKDEPGKDDSSSDSSLDDSSNSSVSLP